MPLKVHQPLWLKCREPIEQTRSAKPTVVALMFRSDSACYRAASNACISRRVGVPVLVAAALVGRWERADTSGQIAHRSFEVALLRTLREGGDVGISSSARTYLLHAQPCSMRSNGPLLCCRGRCMRCRRGQTPAPSSGELILPGAPGACARIWRRPEGRRPAQPVAVSPESVASAARSW